MSEKCNNVLAEVFQRVAKKTGIDLAVIEEACIGEIEADKNEK